MRDLTEGKVKPRGGYGVGGDSMNESSWFAFNVMSRREKNVARIMQLRDHESFVPLYQARHKWADRYKTVELPLFPGYVFCRVARVALPAILAIPGIVDAVRCGTSPAEVCAKEIDALKRVGTLKAEPWPEFVGVQSVAVVDGPLSGITGALVEIKNQWRLLISVAILRRSVLVEIDRNWVVPIHSTESLRA
jgi:transcription antitermination factor NusG